MNFLSELLAVVDSTQLTNIKDKTPRIAAEISRLKCEVKTYMENSHVNFKSMKKRNTDLLERANKLNDEMRELHGELENLTRKQLPDCAAEIVNLSEDLKESTFSLKLVTQLVTIDDNKKQAVGYMKQGKYFEAIERISAVKRIIHEIPDDEQLDIIQALAISMAIEHQSILNEVGKVWNESVTLDSSKNDDETEVMSIKINSGRSDGIKQSIMALCFDSSYVFQLQHLANFLLNNVFTSIINHHCSVETSYSEMSTLTINVNKKLNKLPYTEVFQNIHSVVDFLNVTINFGIQKDLVLLGYVGQKISEEFCELLIKNCLADTVPTTPAGLDKYNNEVVVEIESLQKFLLECAFLTESNQSILEYANNVDVLFANKTCQVYLGKATTILKKDLHDMSEVGTDTSPSDSTQKNLNVFPKCCISRSTCEYLDLLRKILDQASTSSDMCASRLVYTVEQIIGLYGSAVPEYHKKLLETIPQQVALFHNNCMYLANELLTLNKYYRDDKSNRAVSDESFTSQVQLLRTTGANYFLKFMRSQIKQIEDILKESTLSKLGQTDNLDPDCEKYIRQCLRQLELLKTVWQRVLSYEMYNKAIGELLNSFVDNLIKLVIAVEDISADNCTLLVNVYGVVKTRAPKLFTEPKEINLYTKHWYKFNELILILNSSLADINDRWADGKGPLAVEFKPEEVKGLIRALFQNTDRRAAVLAGIV